MSTPYQMNYSDCFPISDTGEMMTLVASTALSFTVPGTSDKKYRANFSINSTADVWVRKNGTAVLPTSGTATSVYNQEKINAYEYIRYVQGGDTLSLISSGTPQIGISFLSLPNS
jgi:hypothetical protein